MGRQGGGEAGGDLGVEALMIVWGCFVGGGCVFDSKCIRSYVAEKKGDL